jgi:hypothetical protein
MSTKEIIRRQNPSFPSPRSDLLPNSSAGKSVREHSGGRSGSSFHSTASTMFLHAHITPGGWTIGPLGASVDRRSLTPSSWTPSTNQRLPSTAYQLASRMWPRIASDTPIMNGQYFRCEITFTAWRVCSIICYPSQFPDPNAKYFWRSWICTDSSRVPYNTAERVEGSGQGHKLRHIAYIYSLTHTHTRHVRNMGRHGLRDFWNTTSNTCHYRRTGIS